MAEINPPGIPVERGKIHEFANSILDENPLYHDEEAAKARGLPAVVAPPTYSSVGAFFASRSGDAGGGRTEGLDMRYVLHGAQEFNFERPIFAGDLLTAEPGEATSYEKPGRRGGKMKFVDSETLYKDQNGDIVLRVKSTLIQTEGVVQE